MIDLAKPLDQVDYKVIPLVDIPDEDAWQVELLRGEYKGKKMVFTSIEYDGKKQTIRFLFDVINADDTPEILTPELEDYGFAILHDIIKKGIADGSVVLNDQNTNN